MFQLETPIPELMLRAAFLFALFLVLFRILPRRTAGEMAPMDFIFLLLVTESAAHSAGDFSSLADGAVQVLTFMGLNYLTSRLTWRFPVLERLPEQPPLVVVRDGRMLRRNMRREFLDGDGRPGVIPKDR